MRAKATVTAAAITLVPSPQEVAEKAAWWFELLHTRGGHEAMELAAGVLEPYLQPAIDALHVATCALLEAC